jgi:hypothetical protein
MFSTTTQASCGAIATCPFSKLHPSGVHRHPDADGTNHGPRVGRGRDRRDPAGSARDRTGHRERCAVPRVRRAAYVTGTELVVDGGAVVV